jgi:hypothetical protein
MKKTTRQAQHRHGAGLHQAQRYRVNAEGRRPRVGDRLTPRVALRRELPAGLGALRLREMFVVPRLGS